MQIVIDIDEERYNQIKRCADNFLVGGLERAIKNGTPLPKEHGKLVDVSEIVKTYAFEKETNALCGDDDAFIEAIKHVSTIIEATKESE